MHLKYSLSEARVQQSGFLNFSISNSFWIIPYPAPPPMHASQLLVALSQIQALNFPQEMHLYTYPTRSNSKNKCKGGLQRRTKAALAAPLHSHLLLL